MKNTHTAVLTLAIGMALSAVSGNAYAGLFSRSRAELPDAILNMHKSDLDGLYQAWLTPLLKDGEISSSSFDIMKDQAAIAKGFERFCSASGGHSTTKTLEFGANLSCLSADGEPIGSFAILRKLYGSNELSITVGYESPVRREAEKQVADSFAESLSRNGPTGWVEAADGRHRILRFGTLDQRSLLDIDSVPIEGVRRLRFVDCCNVEVAFVSGETRRINGARLGDRTAINSRTMGWDRVSMVLIDKVTSQPYIRVFKNGEIRSLDIDPAGTVETIGNDGVIAIGYVSAGSGINTIQKGATSAECMSAQMACRSGSALCATYRARFTAEGSVCGGVNN
jgi:hypothetical protein